MTNLYICALAALQENTVADKLASTRSLAAGWVAGHLSREGDLEPAAPVGEPGRPPRPSLVSAFEVARGSPRSPEGRARLIHALAHIEFNAVNLALDAIYRFRDMPCAYCDDWLRVAVEEAYHFELLRDHLRELGHEYGDFPAHNGLWEMAVRTAHDPLARMALVPKTLEARGLDANPALVRKLRDAGDMRAVEILEIILRDEIGHVSIGNRWFAYLCAQRGLDPLATFRALLDEYQAPRLRPPLHISARRDAGFNEAEIEMLGVLAAEQHG